MKSISYLAMLLLSTGAFADEWVYFKACGFDLDEEGLAPMVPITTKPPNISGYWIKVKSVPLIVGWREMRGMHCTSLHVTGVANQLNVVGTPEEILEKLRIK